MAAIKLTGERESLRAFGDVCSKSLGLQCELGKLISVCRNDSSVELKFE